MQGSAGNVAARLLHLDYYLNGERQPDVAKRALSAKTLAAANGTQQAQLGGWTPVLPGETAPPAADDEEEAASPEPEPEPDPPATSRWAADDNTGDSDDMFNAAAATGKTARSGGKQSTPAATTATRAAAGGGQQVLAGGGLMGGTRVDAAADEERRRRLRDAELRVLRYREELEAQRPALTQQQLDEKVAARRCVHACMRARARDCLRRGEGVTKLLALGCAVCFGVLPQQSCLLRSP